MAKKILPVFNNLGKSKSNPSLPPQVSTAENGVTLVSAESPVPGLCTLGIIGKLGPRFENYDNQGASQVRHTSQLCFTFIPLI